MRRPVFGILLQLGFANPTTIEFTTALPAPTDPDLEENIRISLNLY